MTAPLDVYVRAATLRRVVDADTIDVHVDLGFRCSSAQRLRVLGVDAPERRATGGSAATAWVTAWLAGRRLVIRSHAQDSFGRWLADVLDADTGVSLGVEMLAAGHARVMDEFLGPGR